MTLCALLTGAPAQHVLLPHRCEKTTALFPTANTQLCPPLSPYLYICAKCAFIGWALVQPTNKEVAFGTVSTVSFPPVFNIQTCSSDSGEGGRRGGGKQTDTQREINLPEPKQHLLSLSSASRPILPVSKALPPAHTSAHSDPNSC